MIHKQLVIVGGGIAGLSAAWYAQQHGLDYALVEASERWGGKIYTECVPTEYGPVMIEHGPDSFITQKPWALALARELGMDADLLGTNDAKKRTFVLNKGRLQDLPDGLMLIVPTRFMPFITSPLISPIGKFRMGLEMFIPQRRTDADESLAGFVRRRLGDEALDKLAEPLMSGIYNTDAEQQSLLATFPRFRTLETKYGSLTRGMLAARRSRKVAPHATGKNPPSLFTSFRGGMSDLINTLVLQLNGTLLLNQAVPCITRDRDEFHVILENEDAFSTPNVLLALPSYAAANILGNAVPSVATALREITYVDTGTVSLVYRTEDIPRPLDGFGVVIPRGEHRDINAVTISSNKFNDRTPPGLTMMRVFYGGARSPHTYAQQEPDLIATVKTELQYLTGVTAPPLVTRVVRNPRATAQYDVGHLERIMQIEADLPPGLWLTGSAFRGVGVPDCVHQSQQVISQIAAKAVSAAIT